jgi:hypothetical protein
LDHDPILLGWELGERERRKNKRKMFRYEVMWNSHDGFATRLAQSWKDAGTVNTLQELHDKLSSVAGCLGEWGTHTFGYVYQELKAFEELERLRSDPT